MKQLNYVKLLTVDLGLKSEVLNLWGVGGWVELQGHLRKDTCREEGEYIKMKGKKSAYLFSLTYDWNFTSS